MPTEKKILKTVFLIQLISSFLVVVGHYTASALNYTDHFWILALNQLSRYGTVLLTIATGFITAYSFDRKQPRFAPYIMGKIKFIFVPFVLAGILYHYLLFGGLPKDLPAFLNILLGKTGGHLYYIFMLFQYYLFAYLFRNLITKRNIVYWLLPLMGMQYLYIHVLHHEWLGLTTRHFLPTWIFTFYLGHTLYWYREKLFACLQQPLLLAGGTSLVLLSAVLFVLSDTMYVAVHLRFVLATALSFLLMLFLGQRIVDRLPIAFRKGFTYFIYLFHSAFITMFNRFAEKFGGDLEWIYDNVWLTLTGLAVTYLSTCVFALTIVRLMKRNRTSQSVTSVQA
ncbi:acyltransferase family protein [Brevibacillus fulvus]|uniref:Peptidoglycan/LPS O-acetylase OafA/YrhL n=1 Tax=Brevibacillus fulvus TaxID=1125967 RepID=A0A938Y0J9_9BACL|nr:acyltransferase [Brevibacillus fulvus]MBM7591110.1 peptidoglycan/LPS O-acetylase OafA/YrhL [Brevibacillus fulvus]